VKQFFLPGVSILVASLTVCRADDAVINAGKTVTDTNAPPVNLAVEVARANSEHKLLLLEFGSSDACPPCEVLQQRVFSTPEFQAYAGAHLDFVRLDFPLKVDLRPDTTATNGLLANQFDVDGWPVFIALDKNGKEFWRAPAVGAQDPPIDWLTATPKKFIDLIQQAEKLEK
jgi:thioredoxin-related protein